MNIFGMEQWVFFQIFARYVHLETSLMSPNVLLNSN
jgi:hypothetical protein